MDAIFIFPLGGVDSLKALINKCTETEFIPVIGTNLVHKGYTKEKNRYLFSSSPYKISKDGAILRPSIF